ncbi:MAG: PPA1309 family protein [Sporichthyaceae bacterium]
MNPFLHTSLLEIESHVAADGWDQPTRCFALVETATLLREEPGLAEQLIAAGIEQPPAFTPIEQDEGLWEDLDGTLPTITWGPQVVGCAVAIERLVLPAEVEIEIEHDSPEMPAYVQAHPQREEIRLVVAVLRNGSVDAVLRMRSKDTIEDSLFGPELAPGLAQVLLSTFAEHTEEEGEGEEGSHDDHDCSDHADDHGHGHGHGH